MIWFDESEKEKKHPGDYFCCWQATITVDEKIALNVAGVGAVDLRSDEAVWATGGWDHRYVLPHLPGWFVRRSVCVTSVCPLVVRQCSIVECQHRKGARHLAISHRFSRSRGFSASGVALGVDGWAGHREQGRKNCRVSGCVSFCLAHAHTPLLVILFLMDGAKCSAPQRCQRWGPTRSCLL